MKLYIYNQTRYDSQQAMCQARRDHYLELLQQGMNFTQAARQVGVSKRTGKVYINFDT